MKSRLFRIIVVFILAFFISWIIRYALQALSLAIGYTPKELLFFTSVTILEIFVGIIILIIWFTVLLRSEHVSSKLAWLLLLLISPIAGTIVFLSFGREFKRTKRHKKAKDMNEFKYLRHEEKPQEKFYDLENNDNYIIEMFKTSYNLSKHCPFENENKVEVLTNGDKKFPKLIEELKKAEDFIFMSYFIIKTDNIGKEVMEILREKSKKGVEVRLMYDYLGGIRASNRYLKSLKKDGIKVCAIDPFILGILNTRLNYRNHRKMTVIDGRVAFIGGLNLGDEYNHNSKKFGFWRDTHLMIEGSVINSINSIFVKDWYYATGELIDNDKYFSAKPVSGQNGIVQVIQSGPDSNVPIIRNVYVKMILTARESIMISTPYLILDDEVLTALKIAASSGVKIKILLPGQADKKAVYHVSESTMEPLMKLGVEFYKYKNTFVHAKVLIVDEKIASCGTFNMDIRSFIINFEATVLMTGEPVNKLVSDFRDDTENKSMKVNYETWKNRSKLKKVKEGVLHLFSPIM